MCVTVGSDGHSEVDSGYGKSNSVRSSDGSLASINSVESSSTASTATASTLGRTNPDEIITRKQQKEIWEHGIEL